MAFLIYVHVTCDDFDEVRLPVGPYAVSYSRKMFIVAHLPLYLLWSLKKTYSPYWDSLDHGRMGNPRRAGRVIQWKK